MSKKRIERFMQQVKSKPPASPILKAEIIYPPTIINTRKGIIQLPTDSKYYSLTEEYKIIGCCMRLLWEIQHQPITNHVSWLSLIDVLSEILNKNIVAELLAHLPVLGEVEGFYSNEEVSIKLREIHTGLSAWLTAWFRNEIPIHLQNDSRLSVYEGLARTSENRYKMIIALFTRQLVNTKIFPTPEIAWLLSECSIFWGNILSDCDCKNTLYKNMKHHIDCLNDVQNEESISFFNAKSLEEFLDFIDRYFETLARKCVDDGDTMFDIFYFQPYITAIKHWNSFCKNNPNLQLVRVNGCRPHTRPGKRLGSGMSRKRNNIK